MVERADTMFHVSDSYAREQIAVEGLQPGDCRGFSGAPSGVYLFADRANADYFCALMSEQDQDEYGADEPDRLVWQVDVSGLELLPDPLADGPDDEIQADYPVSPLGSYYVPGPVGPERLTLLDG